MTVVAFDIYRRPKVRSLKNALLAAALRYAEDGIPIFPLHQPVNGRCSCGKQCTTPAKHPRTKHGHLDGTTDPKQILKWWTQFPGANIGGVMGEASGRVAVDVDGQAGQDTLEVLEAEHGNLPDTPIGLTGGGGLHLLFAWPGRRVQSSRGKLGPGIDIKADGGYIVLPPSNHMSGRVYAWNVEAHPDDLPLAPLPDWVERMANMVIDDHAPHQEARKTASNTETPFEVANWIAAHLPIEVKGPRPWGDGGLVWDLRSCPWANRHSTSDESGAWIGQRANGPIAAGCAHASCTWRWRDLRERFEPPSDRQRTGASCHSTPTGRPVSAEAPSGGDGSEDDQDGGTPMGRTVAEGLPEVMIPGAHTTPDEYVEVGADAFVHAAVRQLPNDLLYRRGPHLGELQGPTGHMAFRETTSAAVRILVDGHLRLIRWCKPKKKRKDAPEEDPVRVFVTCGRDHAELIREGAMRSPDTRELHLLTNYPVLVGPRFELLEPGWNAEHRAFYDLPPELRQLTPIQDAVRIRTLLEDLVTDFPFKAPADRENFFGLLLTPIVRPAQRGCAPGHLILASLERTGKTMLARQVVGSVILGRPAPLMSLVGSEEEREKRVIGNLRAADTLLVLDNVPANEILDSAVLSALMTSDPYKGRELGKNQNPEYPNHLTVILTGNNIRATGEMSKRFVPIMLQPDREDPENRSDFRHPDLDEYLLGVRVEVLAALLGAIELWRAAGCPRGGPTKGGFEPWSRTVGGILQTIGYTEWRTNERAWIRAADTEGEDLRNLVEAWSDRYGPDLASTKDLYAIAETLNIFPETRRSPDANGRLVSFSRRVLRKHVDRPVANHVIRAKGSGSSQLYYLDEKP